MHHLILFSPSGKSRVLASLAKDLFSVFSPKRKAPTIEMHRNTAKDSWFKVIGSRPVVVWHIKRPIERPGRSDNIRNALGEQLLRLVEIESPVRLDYGVTGGMVSIIDALRNMIQDGDIPEKDLQGLFDLDLVRENLLDPDRFAKLIRWANSIDRLLYPDDQEQAADALLFTLAMRLKECAKNQEDSLHSSGWCMKFPTPALYEYKGADQYSEEKAEMVEHIRYSSLFHHIQPMMQQLQLPVPSDQLIDGQGVLLQIPTPRSSGCTRHFARLAFTDLAPQNISYPAASKLKGVISPTTTIAAKFITVGMWRVMVHSKNQRVLTYLDIKLAEHAYHRTEFDNFHGDMKDGDRVYYLVTIEALFGLFHQAGGSLDWHVREDEIVKVPSIEY